MRKFLVIIPLLSIILFSCQKEIDFVNGGGSGGGGTSSQKLVRIGTRSGTDTTTEDLSYNSAGKLIRQYISGISQGTSFYVEAKYNRNSSGIITNVVLKSDQFTSLGIDSVVTVVKYNTSTSRYTNAVTAITIFGFTLKDSAVYSYDGSGRITQEETFSADPLSGLYLPSSRDVYTYLPSGNVGNEKYYSYDQASSSYQLSEEYTDEYDSKTNPLQVGMEAIFIGDLVLAASNNLTKSMYVDATDPSNNETVNVVYTYNSANKPVTSTSTTTPGGAITTATYTYQ